MIVEIPEAAYVALRNISSGWIGSRGKLRLSRTAARASCRWCALVQNHQPPAAHSQQFEQRILRR